MATRKQYEAINPFSEIFHLTREAFRQRLGSLKSNARRSIGVHSFLPCPPPTRITDSILSGRGINHGQVEPPAGGAPRIPTINSRSNA
jgi:hypothetical protein